MFDAYDEIAMALEREGYEVESYNDSIHVYVLDTVSPGPGGIYNMMPSQDMADDIYEIASMYDAVDVHIDRQSKVVVVYPA